MSPTSAPRDNRWACPWDVVASWGGGGAFEDAPDVTEDGEDGENGTEYKGGGAAAAEDEDDVDAVELVPEALA